MENQATTQATETAAATAPATSETATETAATAPAINYAELVKSPEFQAELKKAGYFSQSEVDKRVNETAKTAAQKALEKAQRLSDSKLTHEKKIELYKENKDFDGLTKYLTEYAEGEKSRLARELAQSNMAAKAVELFAEIKAPDVVREMALKLSENEDDLQDFFVKLSNYEFFPKGTLEEKLKALETEVKTNKTKQAPPMDGGTPNISAEKDKEYAEKLKKALKIK